MQNPLNKAISALLLAVVATFAGPVLAQASSSLEYNGRRVPEPLLTTISVDLQDMLFEEALGTISGKGGFKLNYNRSRLGVHQKVTVKMERVPALEVLIHVLNRTGAELLITPQGQLAVVPSGKPNQTPEASHGQTGQIEGRVLDADTGEPLYGTNVLVVGTRIGASTGPDGRFTIVRAPLGTRALQFSHVGYELKTVERIGVDVQAVAEIAVTLTPETILLKEVTVTPGQFSIMGSGPSVRQTLTRDDLETAPLGEDIYRAIHRLPGISAGDFSARFTVRGGENDQVLVLMDGLELYEPFHLKDIDGGALSIIDVAAIEGVDLMTGSFPAEYGDRMSGVFNIRSTRARNGRNRTSLGVSFMNARVMSEGTFNDNRGTWLLSARRGYLDLILDLMKEVNPPRPAYYDVLGKADYQLGGKHRLAVNVLHAGDRLDYVEEDEIELDEDTYNTEYGNSYGWLTLRSVLSSRLFAQSTVSYGRLTRDRDGIDYLGHAGDRNFTARDEREVDVIGLKQDWSLDVHDRWYMKWGVDLKDASARYDYRSTERNEYRVEGGRIQVRVDTTTADLDPSGRRLGVYLSNRFRMLQPLTAEIGLRYDRNTYTGDRLLSPRVNMVYELGGQTFLRGGWGYFYQSQGIHEIGVGDGESSFFPAQLAKHWVAGLEHTLGNGVNLRLEGYYKALSDLRPEYRNWSNGLELFPETQLDRFRLNYDGATSKGIEAYLKYDRGGKVTWWASYALSKADDDVRSITFEGVEVAGAGGVHPGKRDQRHALYLDVNYRPNWMWHLNLSWQFHTGWPYTAKTYSSTQTPSGSFVYYRSYGSLNGATYPAYHRMDLRISRHFSTSRGRLSAFLAVINVYNRANERNIYHNWYRDRDTGRQYPEEKKEHWFKLLPSLGVSWAWDH
jgi:outer membrane cobalamin receptor